MLNVIGFLGGLVEWQASSPHSFERRGTMVHPREIKQPSPHSIEAESGAGPDNSLLPMLIGGLVLIVIGAVVVMTFV